ncbi:MAG: aminotransferase class V-fold PLP-dependent enzyme [Wolinella sp.]
MIYLDNAATTFPKPPQVAEAVLGFLQGIGASAGRSGHSLSINAGRIVFEAREAIAALINNPDSSRIIFTHNATHAINSILYGLLKRGDRVLVSPLEHNSVMRPLNALKASRGIGMEVFAHDSLGEIDLASLKALAPGAKLIVSTHANNVTGAVLPIKEIAKIAHEAGAYFMLDAAQSAGILEIDMQDLGVDFLCASGHKGLMGIQGSGFFALHPRVDISELSPIMQGGTGSRSELEEQPLILPDKFECGTLNGHGIAALNAGIAWISSRGIAQIHKHELELREALECGLREISGVEILEIPSNYDRIANISFFSRNLSVSTLAQRLDSEYGILTRASLHCSPSTHRLYGTLKSGAVRLSPGIFTTHSEIEKTLEAIKKLCR